MDRASARISTRPAADRQPEISATPSTARRGPSCRGGTARGAQQGMDGDRHTHSGQRLGGAAGHATKGQCVVQTGSPATDIHAQLEHACGAVCWCYRKSCWDQLPLLTLPDAAKSPAGWPRINSAGSPCDNSAGRWAEIIDTIWSGGCRCVAAATAAQHGLQ